MTDDSLVLAWIAPEHDGGGKIIEYIVEIRQRKQTEWTKVGVTDGDRTNILVDKLKKGHSYQFRITARNEAGVSPPLETEKEIIAGNKLSKIYSSKFCILLISY